MLYEMYNNRPWNSWLRIMVYAYTPYIYYIGSVDSLFSLSDILFPLQKAEKLISFCNYWGFHKCWDDEPQYAENCKIPFSVLKEDPVTSFLLISVFYHFFKNI